MKSMLRSKVATVTTKKKTCKRLPQPDLILFSGIVSIQFFIVSQCNKGRKDDEVG